MLQHLFWSRWPVDLSNAFNAVVVIALLHALYLATFVSRQGVFDAARLYARQLLLASESLSFSRQRLQQTLAAGRESKDERPAMRQMSSADSRTATGSGSGHAPSHQVCVRFRFKMTAGLLKTAGEESVKAQNATGGLRPN
jgi:hypothetical protein